MRTYLMLTLALILLLLTTAVFAQVGGSFGLTWTTVSGGGNVSTGGTYHLTGVAGQPLVAQSSDARFTLNSGFLAGAATPSTLILLYINADNDLAPYIQDLVHKVHEGADNPAIVTFMVLDWPGADNSYLYQVTKRGISNCNVLQLYTCKESYTEGQNVWSFTEDLGAPASLTRLIAEAIQKYPSTPRIALSLVGHGGGWSPTLLAGQPKEHVGQPDALGGLLWDNHTGPGLPGNSLSTIDLGMALRTAHENTGRKIDLLYLDACLMGMWEVAVEIQDSVDYLLASESWSWTSFAYAAHLHSIDEAQTVSQIGQTWLQNEAAILRADAYPFTYALVNLNQMADLTQAINNLATALTAALVTDKNKIKDAFLISNCFDNNQDYTVDRLDNYCDLASFARQIEAHFSDNNPVVQAAKAVQTAVANAVVREDHGNGIPGHYANTPWVWGDLGGLSIYVPLNPEQDDWKRRFYPQLRSSQSGLWDEFISAYWGQTEPPVVPSCAVPCSLPAGPLPIETKVYLPLIGR